MERSIKFIVHVACLHTNYVIQANIVKKVFKLIQYLILYVNVHTSESLPQN